MVSEVLQSSIAEEVESIGVVIPAVHAANPEKAIEWLQESGLQPLHLALPHLHLRVVPEEVAGLMQVQDLQTKQKEVALLLQLLDLHSHRWHRMQGFKKIHWQGLYLPFPHLHFRIVPKQVIALVQFEICKQYKVHTVRDHCWSNACPERAASLALQPLAPNWQIFTPDHHEEAGTGSS